MKPPKAKATGLRVVKFVASEQIDNPWWLEVAVNSIAISAQHWNRQTHNAAAIEVPRQEWVRLPVVVHFASTENSVTEPIQFAAVHVK